MFSTTTLFCRSIAVAIFLRFHLRKGCITAIGTTSFRISFGKIHQVLNIGFVKYIEISLWRGNLSAETHLVVS